MQIKALLLNALRDKDPKQFNQLSRSGQLETWMNARLQTANELYAQLTANADKLPNGVVRSSSERQAAEEQAIAGVIEDLI